MTKKQTKSLRDQKRARPRRREARTLEETGEEFQGRAGEPLPRQHPAEIESGRNWEDEKDEPAVGAAPPISRDRVVEIEYERGPGSRFQIAGRGARAKADASRTEDVSQSRLRRSASRRRAKRP